MRLRLAWLVAAMMLAPAAVVANDHSADMNAAFSFSQGSKLWGTYLALGITPVRTPGTLERISIIGDLGIHKGTDNAGSNVTRVAFSIGGRVWATPDPWRNRLFGQFGIGRVRDHVGTAVDSNAAAAVGIGYEFHLRDSPLNSGLATRVQVDYLFVNDVKDRPRVSVGIVYRID